ncbi:MAG: hypothetical protein HYT08_04210 [Candidatus Levybacteria bacterium]|nr:hypothetical protein [Candidatus Levybacteria bacterium]
MKDNTLIYSDIIKAVKTTADAEDFLSQIDALFAKLFKTTPGSFDENLKKIIGSNFAALLRESLEKNNINKNDQSSIEKFLNGLKDYIQQLKILKLQIAFQPSDEMIDDIFVWVSENIGQGIILDISYDISLIGGAIITFEGKYRDLSLKKRFSDIFEKNGVLLKKPK